MKKHRYTFLIESYSCVYSIPKAFSPVKRANVRALVRWVRQRFRNGDENAKTPATFEKGELLPISWAEKSVSN